MQRGGIGMGWRMGIRVIAIVKDTCLCLVCCVAHSDV